MGVVWATDRGLYPLRAPKRDGQGLGEVMIFHWMPLARPKPKPKPMTGWEKFKAGLRWMLEQEGKAAIAQSQADLAASQAMAKLVTNIFTKHQDDGLGVALDIICVAATIVLLPEILAAGTVAMGIGLAAAAGGAALLVADGAAYGVEMWGDDEAAEEIKKKTETLRIIATVMTLPDLAYGGFKAVSEYREVRELMEVDARTAEAAEKLGQRTANPNRAQRYEQIAERAQLRAQLRAEQLAASRKLELLPRAAGTASVGLLTREEIESEESMLHEVTKRLQIHSAIVHKEAGVK